MPPAQPLEIIIALGIVAGVVMFLVLVTILGIIAVFEEVVRKLIPPLRRIPEKN